MKVIFLLFLTILFAGCSSKPSSLDGNDDDSSWTGNDNNGTLPVNDDGLPGGGEDPDEENDEGNVVEETRECTNVCGFGIEELIGGEWKNCSAPEHGDTRECFNANEYGVCEGIETCDLEDDENPGWTECDAQVPEPEIYDGIDNNCSGEIDDGLVNPVTDGEVEEGLVFIDADDPDNPTDKDGLSLSTVSRTLPYLWAANHEYGSVSKFNTQTHTEEGRYWVGTNPSRTAVDLDGNMWVGGRDDGRVTKILWDTEKCPDTNGIPGIQTSYIDGDEKVIQINSAADPFADECVVYSAVTNPSFPSIRGMAVGSDGRVWIGYSYGGIQSIDPDTFELGPYIPATGIPLWKPDTNDYFQLTEQTVSLGGSYGLISDSNGILYTIDIGNRANLGAYDTVKEEWIGAYQRDGNCGYGIAVDGKNRIWMGGWPDCGGVLVFDPETMKSHTFAVPSGTVLTPKGESNVTIVKRGAPGGDPHPSQPGWRLMSTTGVTVDPATGNVWTSFFIQGYTGKLIVNEEDFSLSKWEFIATMYREDNPAVFLDGVTATDLRGVGFDSYGYVWTLGLGTTKVIKLDPATNSRAADLPEGKVIGQGTHYTYSDFTGSTAFNFTAPRGIWKHTFNKASECSIPSRIDVTAYVPEKTYMGVRIRPIDNDDQPIEGWLPEIDTGENYFNIPVGIGETLIELEDHRDHFIPAQKFEVEVLMSTTDKNIRPILNALNIMWKYDKASCPQ